MPTTNLADAMRDTAAELTKALLNPHLSTLFTPMIVSQMAMLRKLAEVFSRCSAPTNTIDAPPRVPPTSAHPRVPSINPLPRVLPNTVFSRVAPTHAPLRVPHSPATGEARTSQHIILPNTAAPGAWRTPKIIPIDMGASFQTPP